MSDKQRHLFANKLSELPEMGRYSEGTESYQQFAVRIAEMLQDSQKFQELFPLSSKSWLSSCLKFILDHLSIRQSNRQQLLTELGIDLQHEKPYSS